MLKVGFTCLTDIELGIFSSTDANFYKGFSTLLSENDLFFNTSPELGYNKFNLFNLNIFLNKD